jgi:hypothetical protein
VDASKKYSKQIICHGSQSRSNVAIKEAMQKMREGLIGEVYMARGLCYKWRDSIGKYPDGPMASDEKFAYTVGSKTYEPAYDAAYLSKVDYDMWLGPAPKRGYNSVLSPRGVHKHFPDWRKYREFGGGMVTDWGAHHFDIAQWGLGMDDSGPIEIFPANNPKATEGVRLLYANGVEVLHKNSGFGITFIGTDGKVLVNRGRFEIWLGEEKKTDSAAVAEKDCLKDAKVKLYNSTDHKTDWLTAIKGRSKPICDVETGARSVTVCHLVNLAYYHGEHMKWNPAKNQFTDKTGNKEWLDVPQRGPWKV